MAAPWSPRPTARCPWPRRPTRWSSTSRVDDVDQALLERTTSQTYCPYKGDASYYTVKAPDGSTEKDVVWTYEHPYPSVAEIAGHVAFYRDRAEITIDPA